MIVLEVGVMLKWMRGARERHAQMGKVGVSYLMEDH